MTGTTEGRPGRGKRQSGVGDGDYTMTNLKNWSLRLGEGPTSLCDPEIPGCRRPVLYGATGTESRPTDKGKIICATGRIVTMLSGKTFLLGIVDANYKRTVPVAGEKHPMDGPNPIPQSAVLTEDERHW